MASETRRSIEELLARYELEPELRDIYVEGQYDKDIFSVCLGGVGNFSEVIYDVGTVNVPNELLLEFNLSSGNKQRVIALAKKLSVLDSECVFRCVVDRDLDHWLQGLEDVPRLKWTEHTSVELYFFTKEIISQILLTATRSKIKDMDLYMSSLTEVLRVMYAMRLVDKELEWKLEWLEPTKQLSELAGAVQFNAETYIRNVLASNKKSKEFSLFNERLIVWMERLDGDPRSCMRGHDLVFLLAWTVKEFNGVKEFQSQVAMERAFVLVADKAPDLLSLVR
ncbi:hypothetical protein ACQ9Y2_07745 [Pseudomonas palleroniana]|uniref:hypothetical protein n=1 Tax=Pseudomonas palleroniana TaxID=191390 RepID=UPI003B00BBA0